VVHLIYRRKPYESHHKDYEFSRVSMCEHWNAGNADVVQTLAHPEWKGRSAPRSGIHVFDLTRGVASRDRAAA